MRLLLAALALTAAARAAAGTAEQGGATAAPVLQIPMGARAVGMGSAYTAVADDPSALYYNPAGLSRLSAHELSAAFSLGLADNSLDYFAYGGPVSFTGISGNGYASFGSSLLYARNGTIQVNLTNSDGSFLSTQDQSAGWDMVATAGYSERVGMIPVDMGGTSYEINNFVGIAGKLIHSSLAQKFTATAYAADLGYLVAVPELGVSAGFSALNFGSKMTFLTRGDPLPATLRYGAAYAWGRGTAHVVTVAADGDYLVYDKLWHAYSGLEFRWLKYYALRLGYIYNKDKIGITAGVGAGWRDILTFDYAWTDESLNQTNTHTVSLNWKFGGVATSVRETQSHPALENPPERESPEVIEEKPKPAPRQRKSAPAQPQEAPAGVPGWIY